MSATASSPEVFVGSESHFIHSNTNTHHFLPAYSRHPPFAMEPSRLTFSNSAGYDSAMNAEVCIQGDMLWKTWLVWSQPACSNTAKYIDNLGLGIIKEAKFIVNGQTYDELDGNYIDAEEELMHPSDRHLDDILGKVGTADGGAALVARSIRQQRIWAPLPFHYSKAPHQAWNHVGSSGSNVRIQVRLRPVTEIVHNLAQDGSAYAGTAATDVSAPTDLHVVVETIYFNSEMRRYLVENDTQWIIDQSKKVAEIDLAGTESSKEFEIVSNNPAKEVIMFYRSTTNENNNEWFNYSDTAITGQYQNYAFSGLQLKFNGQVRVDDFDPIYFNKIQPRQHHTRIPAALLYVYSFAIFPEECDNSGDINLSMVHKVHFKLNWSSNSGPGTAGAAGKFYVYVRSKNIHTVHSKTGVAALSWSAL